MVFDMIANAPGVLVSTLQWGRLQNLTAAGGDPDPALSLNPTAFDFNPPKVQQWNLGVQHKLIEATSSSTWPTWVPSRRTCSGRCRSTRSRSAPRLAPQNQDPTRAPSATLGSYGAAQRPAAALPGLRRHPDVGLQRVLQLPRAPDRRQPPVRRRVHVLELLRLEQGAGHQQHRLLGRGAEPHRRGNAPARLLVPGLRPHAQLRGQLHLPDAEGRERRARRRWRTTGRSRASTAGRAAGRTASASRFRTSAPRTSPAPTATRTRAWC